MPQTRCRATLMWCLAYTCKLSWEGLHECVYTQLVFGLLAVVWGPTCVCMDPVGSNKKPLVSGNMGRKLRVGRSDLLFFLFFYIFFFPKIKLCFIAHYCNWTKAKSVYLSCNFLKLKQKYFLHFWNKNLRAHIYRVGWVTRNKTFFCYALVGCGQMTYMCVYGPS
jgi:hypothetical protein